MKEIIDELIKRKLVVATMESCTGGGLANAITNIPNASMVFLYGAVTYSNEFKIKMGVDKNIIDQYSVYSIETARDMARAIKDYVSSDFGIGITGKLNKADPNNLSGSDNGVFISIYYNNKYYDALVYVDKDNRKDNKTEIIEKVINMLGDILWSEK